MKLITEYLLFIKANLLEEAARENMRLAKEMDIPMMAFFKDTPDEILIAQSVKSLTDFANSLADGTYLEKQVESLKKWEEDRLEGVPANLTIQPKDLVVIYALQRKMLRKFITKFTSDTEKILQILQELDDLQTQSQEAAVEVLFRKQQKTEELVKIQSQLLDHATDAILTTDAERRINYINKACEKIFGFSKEELLGKLSHEAFRVDPAYEKLRAERVTELERTGTSGAEIVYISKAGEPVPVLISASHMQDKNGKRSGLFVVFKDISDRLRHEKTLRELNDFLNAILENIPNMIFVKDVKELRFVRLNKAGEELLGLSREELTGKNDYDFFPKEQADFFTSKDREVLMHGGIADIPEEKVNTLKNGLVLLHTKKLPIYGTDGKPGYLLGISEDITRQKESERRIISLNSELNQKVLQLNALNKELEAFSYSVSHDLRAPLRAVNGYSNILEEEYGKLFDEEGKRLLGVIRYNAQKMGQLIDDLLAFSRLGRKELDLKPEDLSQLAEGALFELNKTTKHHAEISIEKLHKANVDYGLLHQVFVNLLSNAVKYSSKKEKPVIHVCSEEKEDEIIYSVRDNGVGFDMRYYDKLFGVFQRLHKMEEFEGTGVGLAIVQRIISKHHGRVWAKAAVSEGATFFFSLPKIKSADQP